MREGCHHHNIPIGQGLKTLNELYFYHQQEKLESYRVVDCVDFKFIVRRGVCPLILAPRGSCIIVCHVLNLAVSTSLKISH